MTPVIRPATQEDIEAFIGKRPTESVVAYAVEYGGDVVALAGRTLSDNFIVVSSNIKEIKAPKMLVFRTAQKVLQKLIKKDIPMYAVRNKAIPNAGRFLEALGFYQIGGSDIYKYEVLT